MTTNAFELTRPRTAAVPLLLDSPHSGCYYPPEWRTAATRAALRTAEDTHVEALFACAPRLGATLLAANYPRAYIDCNRSVDDIDPQLIDDAWPFEVKPSAKSQLGYGLVWRRLDDGSEIYDRPLSVAEVQSRITNVYRAYWEALRTEADRLQARFGVLFHLNCHSMPSRATYASHLPLGTPHADIVLGDRDGSTSDSEFVALLENEFRALGYSVRRNDPYKGVEIVRALGQPGLARHSVQLEINRALYMNEATREPNGYFPHLSAHLERVLTRAAQHARDSAMQASHARVA